jgi:hypothetical protein
VGSLFNLVTISFVVTFPYTHVSYTELVHPFHYSLSYPFPLLKVTSTSFNVPCFYLYEDYISHIHPSLLSSFTLPFLLVLSL